MELGEETSQILRQCGDSELDFRPITVQHLACLSSAVLSVVGGEREEEEAMDDPVLEEIEGDLLKRIYGALVCLFVEAAKLGLFEDEFRTILIRDFRFEDSKVDVLCGQFCKYQQIIRNQLSSFASSSDFPSLVGTSWRLDYCLSTSSDKMAREPLLNVSFHTKNSEGSKSDDVSFVCGMNELQDLVSTLKDACKSVERVLNSLE